MSVLLHFNSQHEQLKIAVFSRYSFEICLGYIQLVECRFDIIEHVIGLQVICLIEIVWYSKFRS